MALEVSVPISDLTFYKLDYKDQIYFPLTETLTLRLRGELGYGDSYGDEQRPAVLRELLRRRIWFGARLQTEHARPAVDAIAVRPVHREGPTIRRQHADRRRRRDHLPAAVREGRPLDAARCCSSMPATCSTASVPNVSTICDEVDLNLLRYSVGFSLTWITGMGPMTFGIAKAFNYSDSGPNGVLPV